jgi:hypothetical protein
MKNNAPSGYFTPSNENPKERFEQMIKSYITSNPVIKSNNQTAELEVRFNATNKYTNYISKINYDNAVKQLYQLGFDSTNKTGIHMLRISNEYTDPKTGYTKISNIRAELAGIDLIQEYCKTNSIQKVIDLPSTASTNRDKIKFTRKTLATDKTTHTNILPVDFKDFGFRVSYQMEEDFAPSYGIAREIISKWTDTKKLYRYLNRVRFSHPHYPVFADISIIKESKKTKKTKEGRNYPIPTYTLEESGLFTNDEKYDIELEIDNSKVGIGTEYDTPAKLLAVIRKLIRNILSAFQKTNYPIAFSEMENVQQMYLNLIQGVSINNPNAPPQRISPKNFIGPNSYTLQLSNITAPLAPENEPSRITDLKTPTIRNNMTVTDKADGERRMLFIAPNGRVYMIDTNMNIIFTGYVANSNKPTSTKIVNSLIDGEFIKYNKQGNIINLFAGFDIYFINGKSVREYAFTRQHQSDTSVEQPEEENATTTTTTKAKQANASTTKNRLQLLNSYISAISLIPVEQADTSLVVPNIPHKQTGMATVVSTASGVITACSFRLQPKTFYMTTEEVTIFQACNEILTKVKDGLFEYNTDGLIFTPSNTGVGSSTIGVAGPLYKITWENSFKWKPPEYNTIDFLVTVKKDAKGNHEIHNILQEGTNIQQYKTLVLMCGFDINKHSNINPYLDVINDRIPTQTDLDNNDTYIPVPFQPTEPFDSTAYICNIILQNVTGGNGGNGSALKSNDKTLVMKTVEGEYFEEDMIVEFSYDFTKRNNWRWIPLRVRYDKTSELRAGIKNYGNAYHVANNNWTSIHNPITEEMISTGEGISATVTSITEDDIYYNTETGPSNTSVSLTRALRDFHNLYIKTKLIESVSERGHILIDYACGKGGDLPKWIQANLAFIFGIDISRDNIQNRLNGACSRYINYKKKYKNCPSCLFAQGNSASNIRTNEQAFYTDKDKEIARAIFGKGPKDAVILGKGVYKNYAVAKDGFHISSVQFALHYFFENNISLNQFMRNLSECTRLGGYFIGTCYDGDAVFQRLKTVEKGEYFNVYKNTTPILKIRKQYSQTGFPPNENSLGYAIDVLQESINKTIREYLVNYKYLVRILENYGFVELTTEEARQLKLPNSSGLFNELFQQMETEVQQNPKRKYDFKYSLEMSDEEKSISFMNRYFVFKKVRNVDAESLLKTLTKNTYIDEVDNDVVEEPDNNKPGDEATLVKRYRKLKVPKITIDKYEPIKGDSPTEPPLPPVVASTTEKAIKKPRRKVLVIKDTPLVSTNVAPPLTEETPPPPPPAKKPKRKILIIKDKGEPPLASTVEPTRPPTP